MNSFSIRPKKLRDSGKIIMVNNLGFYTRQALSNVKRSVFIILGLSIGISMFAGVLFYFDSYEAEALKNSFTRMDDFYLQITYDEINFSTSHISVNGGILDAINSSKLDLENKTECFTMISSRDYGGVNIFRNFSNNPELLDLGLESFDTSLLKFALFGDDFYSSARFDDYINVIAGDFPQNQNEIFIESNFARNFNLSVGMVTNLTLRVPLSVPVRIYENDKISENELVYLYDYSIDEMIISGIYEPVLSNFNFDRLDLYEQSYNYDEYGNYIVSDEFESPVIFSWFNFSNPENNHPIQLFLQKYLNSPETQSYSINLRSGMMLFYNRHGINLDNINSFIRVVSEQTQILRRTLPKGVNERYSFSESLSRILSYTAYLRFGVQIINVPILIFTLIIGAFSTKINIKNRVEEFLLLRSKGTPKKVITFQILTEDIFNGIISSTVGALIGGFIMFNLVGIWLSPLFGGFTTQSGIQLSFLLKWTTIGEILVLGIILTILSSITSIRYISNMKIADLLKTIDQGEMEVPYDETTLYGKNSDQMTSSQREDSELNIQAHKKAIQTDGFTRLKNELDGNRKRKKKRRARENIYEDAFETHRKKIRKWSYLFILIAFIPMIMHLIMVLSENPTAPDYLIEMGDYLRSNLLYSPYFSMLLFLSPYFLAAGIIRFVTKESPSRFAKLSQKISSIFLRGKSYLVGMEMVKRKQIATVTFLLGIFASLITFLNVVSNTTLRTQIIASNSLIGSDLKLEPQFQDTINSTAQLSELENLLLSIRNEDNESIINRVTTLHSETSDSFDRVISFVNFSTYFNIISEGNKFTPNTRFKSSMRDAIDYNRVTNNFTGAIVSRSVLNLNDLKIGDVINVTHSYYNLSADEDQEQIITAKIVQVIDVMPGIYQSYSYWGSDYEIITLDIGILNITEDVLHATEVSQLIDLNLDAENNRNIIESYIRSATVNYTGYDRFRFYEQRWNDVNYNPYGGSIGASGFFGIVYLIFVVIGTQLAFGLAVLISASQRENRSFTGILLSRGFGKRGIFKFIFSQFIIIYLIAFIFGIPSGFITSLASTNLLNTLATTSRGFNFPIYFNGLELFAVLGAITGISFLIYIITYIFEMRKSIADYMHKF